MAAKLGSRDEPLPDFELESAISRKSASFQQWVETFFYRQAEFNPDRASRRRYRGHATRLYEAFERENGPAVASLYGLNVVAAAMLTRPPRRFLPRNPGKRWRTSRALKLHLLHNIVDTPVEDPETLRLSKLLYDCQELAVRVNELISGKDRRIATEWIFTLVTDVLARLDEKTAAPPFGRKKPPTDRPAGVDRKVELLPVWRAEFKRIQGFFERSATRGARVRYLWGMITGFVVLGIGGWPSGWALSKYVEGIELQSLFGSFIAGAIGAIMSVMWRMTRGKLSLPVEAGADHVRRLGVFRPVLGAIFGLFVFFVIDSGILVVEVPDEPPVRLSFFIVFGFLAGFSERFVKDVLAKAEESVPQ